MSCLSRYIICNYTFNKYDYYFLQSSIVGNARHMFTSTLQQLLLLVFMPHFVQQRDISLVLSESSASIWLYYLYMCNYGSLFTLDLNLKCNILLFIFAIFWIFFIKSAKQLIWSLFHHPNHNHLQSLMLLLMRKFTTSPIAKIQCSFSVLFSFSMYFFGANYERI